MRAVRQLDQLLARKRSLEASAAKQPQLAARLRELRAWQTDRLARTYDDLRRNPRYSQAVEFFLSDLYGPQDFTRRDQELMRAGRYLTRSLSARALDVLERVIEVEVLSAELDQQMAAALLSLPVTAAGYANAYRAVGRQKARERQIDLIVGIGEDLERLVTHRWVRAALRLAHGPARATGFAVLQDFLERGFTAFRSMEDAQPLLRAIRERETQLMQALFRGDDGVRALGGQQSA